MQIRPMCEADLDAVLAIAGQLPSAPQWPRQTYAAMLPPDANPQRSTLVATMDGAVAGFAVAGTVAGEAEIESIAVAPQAQRRGIGAALLKAILEDAASEGAVAVVLEVRAANRAAIALYRPAGFREAGRRRGYYRDPVEDAVLMRLEIPQSQ